MKVYRLYLIILSVFCFFNRGLMAEQSKVPSFPNWVTMQDEATGLKADFPQKPVEMNIEFPFQNTPPTGQLRLYSTPTSKGLLAMSTFFSPTFNVEKLEKEKLKVFFETVLVPHFFFSPAIFQDHQTYHFHLKKIARQETASFQFSFKDQKILKKLEGIAFIQDKILYIAFYMASDHDFDSDILSKFLSSIQFPKEK